MLRTMILSLFAMTLAMTNTARATEEPRFNVVDKIGTIEIRAYGPRLAAEPSRL